MKLLEETLESMKAAPPTDLEVDAFLSLPTEFSEEEQRQMYIRYVEKVFKKLHPRPITRLTERWPLGRWLESTRSNACLAREDVADALGKNRDFVTKIEAEEILPWELTPSDAAKVASLFRLHAGALAAMVYTSYAVHEARRKLPNDLTAFGLNAEAPGPSVELALDLYYARNAPAVEPRREIEEWLDEVRREMKARKNSKPVRESRAKQ
ncbi:MAG: hypothetical protein M3444_00665 [Acidobacteriota bacterium]|nr:hypothetical protein [Acidobacteriota bacterium]MDQ5835201.1 hypothetical protein [Acidobacteriota bacterium]